MKWTDYKTDLQLLEDPALKQVKILKAKNVNIFPPCELLADKAEPNMTLVYRAFRLTPLDRVRVVILGQDPYHETGQANGLAFSVSEGVKLPPSLKNIFKELQSDLGGSLRMNGDLSDWAKQGVLLLNTSLTVIEGQANSMASLWEPFTDKIIQIIDANLSPVVFILWGGNARKKKKFIKNNSDYIIESAHPSPLSAYRGFFGSKPFSKTNSILKSFGKDEIIWNKNL